MAPVCLASLLSLRVLFVFALCLLTLVTNVNLLLIYDRQTLLNLRPPFRNPFQNPLQLKFPGQESRCPPLFSSIPAHLYRAPLPRWRRRRRGRRSGLLVKLKAVRCTDPVAPCLVSLVGVDVELRGRRPTLPYLRKRGRGLHNLRQLPRALPMKGTPIPARMALVNARSLANKTFILKDFFVTHRLDFLYVTETWISGDDSSAFTELLPPDCSYLSAPRSSGRGGGVATVYRTSYNCKQVTLTKTYSSFEASVFKLDPALSMFCAVIYRPPKYNKDFIDDFAVFLAGIMPKYDRILIVGDFNIHVCCPDKAPARDFLNLINSFNLVQLVSAPTQEQGHTLDLILTHGLTTFDLEICDALFSDHMPVLFNVQLPCHTVKFPAPFLCSRTINSHTAAQFSAAFNSTIILPEHQSCNSDVENMSSCLYSTCQTVLDSVAPLKTRLSRLRSEPWLDETTRAVRRECRRAERKWKKDRLQVSFQLLRGSWRSYQKTMKAAKTKHFSDIIASNQHNPRVLFKTINSVLNVPQPVSLENSTEVCEMFMTFFIDKIKNIRTLISPPSFSHSVSTSCSTVLHRFEHVSLSYLEKLISQMKPSGSPNDPVPPRLFKEVFPTLAPYVLDLINGSLIHGSVPSCFKHAVVTPLIKKPGLDSSILSNFRPISKLPFLSKVLEKIVYCQLTTFLEENSILEVFQSGFKPRHSTESALLRVSNDIFLATDAGHHVVLVLLDLAAAFDTVDHQILLSRLESWVGLRGSALEWFRSYLNERSFCVRLGRAESRRATFTCGVPQGSVLGPLLFSLYLLPLGSILRKHGISFHLYADDSQIYIPLKQEEAYSAHQLLECLDDIKTWMSCNFLHLNQEKTEVLLFGPSDVSKAHVDLGVLNDHLKQTATSLGVKLDSNLTFNAHINLVVKSSFFHLRQLAKVKPLLSRHDFEILIHAFISTRLDYCNALYVGLSQKLLARLQLVQNAAARLLTGTRKQEHITPILASLHWLPVRLRIDFKILLFVFKCLHGLAPKYLSDLIQVYNPPRSLRSTNQTQLVVSKTRRKLRGDRAFSVFGPKIWNELPLYLRQINSLSIFKSALKTYFFTLAFN
uniref:Reverse transcriptase domain-containing protein n=1 Tax=Oryzias latipes TaxID=8090 RepID=A0A3B3HT18_ORYLA